MSDTATVPGEQQLWQQLHTIAAGIYNARQAALQAQAAGDTATYQQMLDQLSSLKDQFADQVDQIRTVTAGSVDLSLWDQAILELGDWITQSYQALPGALAAIPKAFIDAAGQTAKNAGIMLGLPLAAIVVGAIALLLFAEKSKTVRRFL